MRHASTSFKYYANVELIDFPNGIFAEENDRLIVKTQEILLENDLPALLNDDLYEFTNNDLNFTEEIRVSEFSTIRNYNVVFWEGTRIVDENLNQNIYADEVVLMMIIPGIDMIRLCILRIIKNKSPFEGDNNHFHHLLLKKFNHSISIFILSIMIFLPIFLFNYFEINPLKLIIVLFLVYLTILLICLKKGTK